MEVTVKEGVTLQDYMKTYGYTEEDLRVANPDLGDELKVGYMLTLPSDETLNTIYQDQEFALQDRMPSFKEEYEYDYERPMEMAASHVTQEPMEMMASHSDDKIGDLLGERISALGTTVPQKEFTPPATQEQHDMLSEENKKKAFLGRIAEIESGGLSDKFIRTKAYGTGSSAYGPYQVTKGLTDEYLKQYNDIFTPEEEQALKDVRDRQEVSLLVGGDDKEAYRAGGPKAFEGIRLSRLYGYSDVDSFLEAFDYGGDLGYEGDRLALETAQKKMLLKHYEENGGNELDAAAEWHGGKNWKTSKHLPKTQNYLAKYQKLKGKG